MTSRMEAARQSDVARRDVVSVRAESHEALKRAICDEIDARAGMTAVRVTITTPTASTIIFERAE